ncbi:hypothetical protein DYB34_011867 [Aphanomyces astaci]|uniref:Uncharacterized protein n=1 Tax=Aphanomyces astaci TaxID=112090 RepID=A0A3R6ZJR1_APHAT|nr:hypothetical protein DYB34_011867 [Aphanomyces astaci]
MSFRQMTSAAAAKVVLQSKDLVQQVTMYQPGCPKHMRCFRALRRPSLTWQDDVHAAFAMIATVLSSWLKEYGIDRLPSLYACMGHMRGVVLVHAVYSGRVDLIHVVSLREYDDDPPLLDIAAAGGHVAMLTHLLQHASNTVATPFAMDVAASMGRVDIVELLHTHRPQDDSFHESAISISIVHGHISILQFFHDRQVDGVFTPDMMDLAATHGHVHVLEFLHRHRPGLRMSMRAMESAAAGGHFAAVRFLHHHYDDHHLPCGPNVMDAAAIGGHLDIVRFLHLNRPEGCTRLAMNAAATRGDLNMVTWLHVHRPEGGTTSAMDGAATCGHLKVVKFLHTHRSEGCTSAAFWGAVMHNHVEVVEWLLTHKRQWCDPVDVVVALQRWPLTKGWLVKRSVVN